MFQISNRFYSLKSFLKHTILFASVSSTIGICSLQALDETKNFELASPLAQDKTPFRMVREIQERIDLDGVVVIFGAPSSGKTELMDIAIQNKKKIFDLSVEFVDVYCKQSGQDKKAIEKGYQGSSTLLQEQLKLEQIIWLETHRQLIIESLITSEEEVVVMDEFDFTVSPSPSLDEEHAMQEIVYLGRAIHNSGKKVVFIIHSAAKHSELFWDAMQSSFGLGPDIVAQTGFFSDEEEDYLLSLVQGTDEEKTEFRIFAQGSPTAYLSILKHKPDLTIGKLKNEALRQSEAVKRATMQINRPEVWEALLAVAKGDILLEDIEDQFLIEGMLESSFVGKKNDRLVMPSFARECLNHE